MLKTIKTIKENIETAIEIADKLKDLELKETVLNLKEQILSIREENISLKELIASNNQKENLIYKNNMYWKKLDDGSEDGPYCSGCYDTKKTLVRMHVHPRGNICPSCKQTIY
ncbi:MAG: hypothetical protein E7019_02590 [Alphaproteobacteria bacterium]|nr:hypothetical protein [Alphaproteobacteria bacterium]